MKITGTDLLTLDLHAPARPHRRPATTADDAPVDEAEIEEAAERRPLTLAIDVSGDGEASNEAATASSN